MYLPIKSINKSLKSIEHLTISSIYKTITTEVIQNLLVLSTESILPKMAIDSCRILYSVVSYDSFSGLISSVGEERGNFSAILFLSLCGLCLEGLSLPLDTGDSLPYFIVALPWPAI